MLLDREDLYLKVKLNIGLTVESLLMITNVQSDDVAVSDHYNLIF